MKFDDNLISKIVHMPLGSINKFIAKNITTDVLGKRTILKSGIRHMSNDKDIYSNINEKQDKFTFDTQYNLLDEVITLLENPKMLNMTPLVVNRLLRLRYLLNKIVIKARKRW